MHKKYIEWAAEISLLSTHKQFRLGAVIVLSDGNIVTGYNKIHDYHPLQLKYSKIHRPFCNSTHAEVDAFSKLKTKCNGATLYVARTMKNGTFGMAKPCSCCTEAAKDFGVRMIYYTTNEGSLGKLELKNKIYVHNYAF